VAACRACQAPLLWVLTEHGKKMPLDYEPYVGDDPRGLFVLRDGPDGTYAMATTPEAFPDEPVYRSHFATCTRPGDFRRPA
jgi:hypothetical protein